MKKIAIVTVNYNTEEDTKTFLKSLEKVTVSGFEKEIFVVDNASREPLTIEEKDNIHLVRLEENTGFTGGFNMGMQLALDNGADYVMIVNNDTTADPGLLKNLIEVLESKENIGMVVPKIYFAKGHEFHKERYKNDELGKVFWYAGGYTDWNNARSIHRGVDEVDHGQYDTADAISFATGCCMLFKSDMLKKVGLFENNYFLYYEDADLSERVQRAGYKIYYAPKAVLYHVNASSSGGAGKGNLLHDYFLTRNQMVFGMKYAPIRTKIALFRQSINLLLGGRPKQKQAIRDYYLGRLGKGTFFN